MLNWRLPNKESSNSMTGPILTEIDASGMATVTVNRPLVRNALNWEAMTVLHDTENSLQESSDLRAVIITGAGGRAFISGGDLRDLQNSMTEEAGLKQHDLMAGTLDRLAALPVPVIAAIEGAARGGGCEIALACDLRVAGEEATIGFAQIDMGVSPGWGGAARLFAAVGYARALDLLLTGRVLTAEEASAIGLVDRIAPNGQALVYARRLVEIIADKAPLAVRGINEVLHGYRSMPADAALARERAIFAQLWATEDHAEATSSFLEKRDPKFSGK
jgi:enoyl-CoA hydratase